MLKWTMGINADAKVDIKESTAKVKFTLLNGFLAKEMMFYICTLPKSPVNASDNSNLQCIFICFVLAEIFGYNRSLAKLIQHPVTITKRFSYTWEKLFIQSEISCQNESVSSQRLHVVGSSSVSSVIYRSL